MGLLLLSIIIAVPLLRARRLRKPPEATPDRVGAALLTASVAVIAVFVLSAGIAFAIGWAKWATTPTFGLISDYVTLIVGTAGSASIAGLASVFLLVGRGRSR